MTEMTSSMYKKTPLRISTMVATAHFGCTLDLNLLFNKYLDDSIYKYQFYNYFY